MQQFEVKMHSDRETKGALFYRELLATGKVVEYTNDPGAHIGVLYIRKTAFEQSKWPKQLLVLVTGVD